MYRGEHVDILYGNVKHAFFQVNVTLYFSFCTEMSFNSKEIRFIQKEMCTQHKPANCRVNCTKNEPYSSSNHFAQDN